MNTVLLADGQDGSWHVDSDGAFNWVFEHSNADGAISWHATNSETGQQAVVRALVNYDADTGEIDSIDLDSIERFTGISSQYDWSPDGSMIAFNDQAALEVFDTVSQQTVSLPAIKLFGTPRWSPDGRQIAYGVIDQERDVSRIETIDVIDDSITVIANGRLQSPLDGTVVFSPHWSPDSSALLYQLQNVRGYSDETHIIRANANGRGKHANLTADLDVTPLGRPWIYGWKVN